MENATKALLIAAGVLMGMLIISLGVYLYVTIGSYVDSTQENIDKAALSKFNTQFFNYVTEGDETLSFQEVLSAANLAYENNLEGNILDIPENEKNGVNNYVRVKIKGYVDPSSENYNDSNKGFDLETIGGDPDKVAKWLRYNYSYKYTCSRDEIKISNTSKRVYEIVFVIKN